MLNKFFSRLTEIRELKLKVSYKRHTKKFKKVKFKIQINNFAKIMKNYLQIIEWNSKKNNSYLNQPFYR